MLKKIKYLQNGDEWEHWINACYRLRYQNNGFQEVPAGYMGDGGIEGYTKTGIVYQCYCPNKLYTDDELWEHQRDKVTTDIKKLINNGEILLKMGVDTPIKEWHFVIPEYKDKRILEHCKKKKDEVINAKKKNSLKHIDESFDIIIKVAEDFQKEIYQLAYLNSDKIDITLKEFEEIDLSKCDSQKIKNIERKIAKAIDPNTNTHEYNQMVKIMTKKYAEGIEIINNIKSVIPQLYETIISIDSSYKTNLEFECLMNESKSLNKVFLQEKLKELDNELKDQVGNVITQESIAVLKFNLMSSWIADCPMDFV